MPQAATKSATVIPLETGIHGVILCPFATHADSRGALTEVFRRDWDFAPDSVQWNYVRSEAGVLRGVHLHVKHADYLVVLEGSAIVGLRDMRPHSPTRDKSRLLELSAENLQALIIPPGVAHGFYFPQSAAHIYSTTEYWDSADELGCQWNDPALELAWPAIPAQLSPRDAALPSYSELLKRAEPALAKCL